MATGTSRQRIVMAKSENVILHRCCQRRRCRRRRRSARVPLLFFPRSQRHRRITIRLKIARGQRRALPRKLCLRVLNFGGGRGAVMMMSGHYFVALGISSTLDDCAGFDFVRRHDKMSRYMVTSTDIEWNNNQ